VELNNRVNVLMRQWIVAHLKKVVNQEKDNEEGQGENEEEEVERSVKSMNAKTLYDVGGALYQMNIFDEALKAIGRCSEIRETILGKDHEDVAEIYNDIGLFMKEKGDLDGALVMYKKRLPI